MNLMQSGVLAMSANVTSQAIEGAGFEWQPALQQGILSVCFIAPVLSVWFPFLHSLKLHWINSTLLDQFVYGPCFNVLIFWFIAAFFKGGVAVAGTTSDVISLTLSLNTAKFPSVFEYEPIFSTLAASYYLWLPATLLREKFVPPHLAPLFVNVIAFAWNIYFAMVMK